MRKTGAFLFKLAIAALVGGGAGLVIAAFLMDPGALWLERYSWLDVFLTGASILVVALLEVLIRGRNAFKPKQSSDDDFGWWEDHL